MYMYKTLDYDTENVATVDSDRCDKEFSALAALLRITYHAANTITMTITVK